jgi:hypothetical protein
MARRVALLLEHRQDEQGRWVVKDLRDVVDDDRTRAVTALVARSLARYAATAQDREREEAVKAVGRALDALAPDVARWDEPYALASFALAAIDSGESTRAREALARLRTLGHEEGAALFWDLQTNTPFFGWGRAGRIETTALAVSALSRAARAGLKEPGDQAIIDRALRFLLSHKDHYSVWWSGQATVNVLEALVENIPAPFQAGSPDIAEVRLDGKAIATMTLPTGQRIAPPVVVPLGETVSPGIRDITIQRSPGAPRASAEVVASAYVPWTSERMAPSDQPLRLSVSYDKTEGQVGDVRTCHVSAERVGFRGYGMMLAEIGLPPGVEVDRESLEKAKGISYFDVLPDRVIVYLWAKAGGTAFDFTFRPRMGMKAKTAASVLYDYYNPEARVVVPPTTFVVREP